MTDADIGEGNPDWTGAAARTTSERAGYTSSGFVVPFTAEVPASLPADAGATFEDVAKVTVGGLPATIATATTSTSLSGGLGCPSAARPADACFGLQPDITIRLAMVRSGEQ